MIISNIVLGSMYGMYGVAIAVMLAELLLAVVMLYYINKLCKNNIGRI
jgi:O-antigen/teichoic acid export membrane protein